MPQVRRYEEGQVQAIPLPASRFSPSATGDSFGGGQAKQVQELGKGLQSIGDGAGKMAAVFQVNSQDRKDKALVRDRLNAAESDMRLFEGDLVKPENREKALDAYATAQKEFTSMRKRYTAELKNDRQRELFTASFDANMNGTLDRAFSLQEKTRVEFEKLTRDAQNQSAIENAVAARTDVNAIKNSEITILANTKAAAVGLPKDVVAKSVADARHNLHASVLSALTQDDPRAAQGYLKDQWDKFNPSIRESLKKEIDEKSFDWTVREDAAKLVNAGLTDDQIEAQIDAVEDPKKADALRARVKDKLEDKKIAREIQDKENVYSSWQGVLQGGDIPYGRLSGAEVKAMESYKKAELKGFAQESDRTILMQVGRLTDAELQEIDEVSMAGLSDKLSREDFNAVFTRYRDLRRTNQVGLEPEKLTQIRNESQMVGDALTALGIDPSLKKKGGFLGKGKDKNAIEKAADQQVINEVTRSFEREINDAQKAQGRKLKPEEKQQILDDLLIKGKVRKTFGAKETEFLFQTDEADLEKNFSVRDIPIKMQEQMQAAFQMRGIAPTPDNIKTYWLQYLKSRKK